MTSPTPNRRHNEPTDRIAELEKQIEEVKEKLDEIYEIVAAAKGFFKVLGAIGAAVKWIAMICAALVGIWVAIKPK